MMQKSTTINATLFMHGPHMVHLASCDRKPTSQYFLLQEAIDKAQVSSHKRNTQIDKFQTIQIFDTTVPEHKLLQASSFQTQVA